MIISDIGILRAKAAYTHLEQQMVFNIDEESYHIISKDNTDNTDTITHTDEDIDSLKKELPAGVDLEDVMWLTGEKIQEGDTTFGGR